MVTPRPLFYNAAPPSGPLIQKRRPGGPRYNAGRRPAIPDLSDFTFEPDLSRALDRGLELTPEGGELVVLPTYTAMLALQRIVSERGLAKKYWERAA